MRLSTTHFRRVLRGTKDIKNECTCSTQTRTKFYVVMLLQTSVFPIPSRRSLCNCYETVFHFVRHFSLIYIAHSLLSLSTPQCFATNTHKYRMCDISFTRFVSMASNKDVMVSAFKCCRGCNCLSRVCKRNS